jgi:hypothetical protein
MTYWARSNSFEFDDDGERAIGAEIYFYDAGTSTPRTTYSDAALTTPNAHPVEADGNGRWPKVFLQYGSYKEIAKTAGGTTLWTTDDIPNPAPTDPGAGVDANAIFQTGDIIVAGKNGTRAGFVRLNGRTMGNAASGGTERANADTSALFAYIWNNYADGQAAVSGGRGATAVADYAANKTIALPDYRTAALIGFDDMGNSARSGIDPALMVSGSLITAGSVVGFNTHTLVAAQLPAHVHTVSITSGAQSADHTHSVNGISTSSEGAHTHTGTTDSGGVDHTHSEVTAGGFQSIFDSGAAVSGPTNATGAATTGGASAFLHTHAFTTGSSGTHTHSISGNTQGVSAGHTHLVSGNTGSIGSDFAHNIVQRSVLGTVLMKL